MKLKLDENLGRFAAEFLRSAGHDVETALSQGLCSAPDPAVIRVCQAEGRCLVTLDLDFSNPLRYRPSDYSGIAVLRLPPRPSAKDLDTLLQTLAGALERGAIKGQLWIVQAGKIRIYQPG